jgi:hypothetical protein
MARPTGPHGGAQAPSRVASAASRRPPTSRLSVGTRPAVRLRELLKAFASLAGAVVTIDALHTQHDTAQVVLSRQADYLMTVKSSMPTLYQ